MKAGVRARYFTKFKARKIHRDDGLYKVKKGQPGWDKYQYNVKGTPAWDRFRVDACDTGSQ